MRTHHDAVNTIATAARRLCIDANCRGMDERMLITEAEFTHSRNGADHELDLSVANSIAVTPAAGRCVMT